MRQPTKIAALVLAGLCLTGQAAYAATGLDNGFYPGFNFPQATFGGPGGVPNKDYMWQQPSDIDKYAELGAKIFRVGFLWERMQPVLQRRLDTTELSQLDALVQEAAEKHVIVLIDVHNFGGYKTLQIGSPDVPIDAYTDLWARLAKHYKDQPAVMFGLMNEPVHQTADEWAAIAQKAINAIRAIGAKQPIFVPGTGWDGAHSWDYKAGDHSNAEALAGLRDPERKLVFEAHEYFDQDSSGTKPVCVSEDIGEKRLALFTEWLKKTGNKGFLGEFGASKDPSCLAALKRTLQHMADNRDVYYGWTYWAAAPWFGDYMFNVYPPDTGKFPQLDVLKAAMQNIGG